MTAHTPKTAALLALEADLLSPEAESILRKHLAGCAVCRDSLAAMRAYDELAEAARESHTPEINWDRMDFALRREARVSADAIKRVKTERKSTSFVWAGMAAAAALAFVGPAVFAKVSDETERFVASIQETIAPLNKLSGVVTASAGRVMRRASDGVTLELRLDDVLEQGDALVASADSIVHARFEDGSGLVLRPNTTIAIVELNEKSTRIDLEQGTISSFVRRLETDDRYEIGAGDYRVRVRGTRFSVTRQGSDVGVSVMDGSVEVFKDGALVQTITAQPASEGGERVAAYWGTTDRLSHQVDQPNVNVNVDAAHVVTFEPSAQFVAWEVDSAWYPAAGRLSMRASENPLEVTAFDMQSRAVHASIPLDTERVTVDPVRLFAVAATEPVQATHHDVPLAASIVQRVVQASSDKLTRCYEQALRQNPSLDASLAVRVTVDSMGRVEDARIDSRGAAAAAGLGECVVRNVRTWSFPARPGSSSSTVRIPIDFGARRR